VLKTRIVQYSIIYLLLAGLTHPAISQSPQSGGTGPLRNDRPLDRQSQRPATDTGQELSKLIGARLSIMQEVAKYKWNKNAPIEDPDREQKLLDSVGKQAQAGGLQPEWAQHFFRLQIEAAKLAQYQLFQDWRRTQHPAFSDAPDLATVVRPRLDALTPLLLKSLKSHWKDIAAGSMSMDDVRPRSMEQRFTLAIGVAVLPFVDGSARANAQ
jgi:chorismate mutase-like protein